MIKLRSFATTAVVGIAAVSLVACSAPATDGAAAESLTVWHNSADGPAILDLYAAFTAETGIEIELVPIPSDAYETTVNTKWATGDRPDILEYHAIRSLLLPLNPAVNMQDLSAEAFVADSGSLYESTASLDGKVYAAVTGFPSVFGFYYNKQILADAGLDAPQTFDDLTSICSALAGTGVAPIFEAGGSAWSTQIIPMMYVAEQNEGDAYASAVASNEEPLDAPGSPFVEGLAAYQQLANDGCFNEDATSATFESGLAAVYNGEAAITALHSDVYQVLLTAAEGDAAAVDETVGFASVSATRSVGLQAAGPFGTFYAPKTGDSGREAAALEFIRFATGDGYQALLDAGPNFPMIDGFETPAGFSELQLRFKEEYDTGATTIFLASVPGFGAFVNETTKLLAGQTTPEAVATSMQAEVEQAAKAAGLPGW